MNSLKNDTIWMNSSAWKRDTVENFHWWKFTTVYSPSETLVYAQRAPVGLRGVAETSRYVPVWVKKTGEDYIPGRMVFGDDTMGEGLEKTELPLDGVWDPIPADLKLELKETREITPPVYKTELKFPEKVKRAGDPNEWGVPVQGICFVLLSWITISWAISNLNNLVSLASDLKNVFVRKTS